MKYSFFLRKHFILFYLCFLLIKPSSALNFKFVYCPNNMTTFPQNIRTQIEGAGRTLGSYIGETHTVTIVVKSSNTGNSIGTGEFKQSLVNTDYKYIALSGIYTINPTKEANFEVLTIHELLHILGLNNYIKAFKNNISDGYFIGSRTKLMNNGKAFPLSIDLSHLSASATYPVAGMSAAIRDGGGTFSILDLALLFDIGYNIPFFLNVKEPVPLRGGNVECNSTSSPCEDLSNTEPDIKIFDNHGRIIDNSKTLCTTTYYSVNGAAYSLLLPIYDQNNQMTIQAKLVCNNDNTIESKTKIFMTYPNCPQNLNSVQPATVLVTDRINGQPGTITAPVSSNCPNGSTINYAINNTGEFSNILPTYDQTTPMTIQTRCYCDRDDYFGSSVRSISTNPDLNTPLKKPDSIPQVRIGQFVWMTKNLAVKVFANGNPIPYITNKVVWDSLANNMIPACCAYDFDSTNIQKFGLLYNWYAVSSPYGLAPSGWRVPTKYEYNSNNVAGFIKDGWLPQGYDDCNFFFNLPQSEVNTTGFSAYPSGCYNNKANFFGKGRFCQLWTASTVDICSLDEDNCLYYKYNDKCENALYIKLSMEGCKKGDWGLACGSYKGAGMAVRCVKIE